MKRTLLIGDIHGCWDELETLLDRAAVTAGDRVIALGDLVDRGPKPAEVVRFFQTWEGAMSLCGNHERKHVRGVLSASQEITRLQLGAGYADAVRWFATLPYFLDEPEFRAMHFGLFPGMPLAHVPEDVLAGTTSGERKLRERFGETPWYAHDTDPRPTAFGHAVVGDDALVVNDRVYGLDTGVCHGGNLTALVLPERRLIQVRARRDHWRDVSTRFKDYALRTQPWATMTFERIERKVRDLRLASHTTAEPPVQATACGTGALDAGEVGMSATSVADHLATWASAVHGLLPSLREQVDARVDALRAEAAARGTAFGQLAAEGPAGSVLIRRAQGRLGETLGCATPEQVLTLASALGVVLPAAAATPPWLHTGADAP